jgi:hypothetical protein
VGSLAYTWEQETVSCSPEGTVKTVRLLHLFCFSSILAEGILSFQAYHRFTVNFCRLSSIAHHYPRERKHQTERRTPMQASELLREQLKEVHQYVEAILTDVTPEQAHWHPPGTIVNSLGGNYAHIIVVEDLVINALLRGGAPLFASTWAGKTGMSTLPPLPTPETPGLPSWQEWSTHVHIDLNALRSYAQATCAASDEYLASLSDEQLRQTVDLSGVGLGMQTFQWILSNSVVGHAFSHSGEIACLKGLQGIQGYVL